MLFIYSQLGMVHDRELLGGLGEGRGKLAALTAYVMISILEGKDNSKASFPYVSTLKTVVKSTSVHSNCNVNLMLVSSLHRRKSYRTQQGV